MTCGKQPAISREKSGLLLINKTGDESIPPGTQLPYLPGGVKKYCLALHKGVKQLPGSRSIGENLMIKNIS